MTLESFQEKYETTLSQLVVNGRSNPTAIGRWLQISLAGSGEVGSGCGHRHRPKMGAQLPGRCFPGMITINCEDGPGNRSLVLTVAARVGR